MRFAAALLMAATIQGGELPPRIVGFTLSETPSGLMKAFRQAPNVVKQPAALIVQFHEDSDHSKVHSCDGDFAWAFYFSASGEMQSITWNPEKPIAVSKLFPAKDRELHSTSAVGVKASVMLRRLSGGRLLIANVNSPDQAELQQAVLMRADTVGRFFPWLAARLKSDKTGE
ncbi:MAG: hypothetical protein H7Y20_13345 [Bryobacteraceae bacterium]|nr:hypothetical protein [Bryobacteraceae bacterium]